MNDVLFRVETPLKYFATLRRQNWEKHEQKREDIRGLMEQVRATLIEPDVVITDNTGCDHYYGWGYGSGRTADAFLHVLVRRYDIDDENEYTVATIWFARTPVKGEVRWTKTS